MRKLRRKNRAKNIKQKGSDIIRAFLFFDKCLARKTKLRYCNSDFAPIFNREGFSRLSEKVTKKEVTPEKFAEFLAWLSPENEKSGEEYERLRFRLVTFFAHRNCRFPEDLADETINRVCVKIGAETIENKTAFVYGFAKNIYLESLRKEKDHQHIDELNVAAKQFEEEKDLSGDCLDKCLDELSDENRALILDYFSEEKQAKIALHRQISAAMRTTQTALRMRVVRIKQKLRGCLEECLA